MTALFFALAFSTPWFLQWLLGRRLATSNTRLYQQPVNPFNAEGGNRSNLEASLPWRDFGSDTASLSDASIRPEEQPTQERHSFELRSRHS